jgi:hypothetical protein
LIDSLVLFDSKYIANPSYVSAITYTYTPNDFGLATSGKQNELDLINAKGTWDISKGSSAVVIGISDSGFDIDHEDLESEIIHVLNNNTGSEAMKHGTQVAGIAGASTDNNIGISSIGFNCKLALGRTGNANFYNISNISGVRVVNGSWFNSCNYYLDGQIVYQEIYENGNASVFGAGNGYSVDTAGRLKSNHCNFGPVFPAAFDYNLSVSSVGSEIEYGKKSWWPPLPDSIYWCMEDVHENVVGKYDTIKVLTGNSTIDAQFPIGTILKTEVHNHNESVDIVAPGYKVRATQIYNTYNDGAYGTSFASPLVAGTIGLMVSEKLCLTPYQIEYGLKSTAYNIYGIPENAAYIGKLGSGRLDAAAAVAWAKYHSCNSMHTSTLIIKGVELNTVCRPGQSSNSVLPKMKVIIERGQAPFTYKWEPLTFNKSTLSSYSAAEPEIIASTETHRVRYRLTVYDNSNIQRVASKIIDFNLTDIQDYDLAMRDSYMDMYNEPNTQMDLDEREWNIWKSPDVWNRKLDDQGKVHQDPEYFDTNPNYVYARVRNVGCVPSPSEQVLRLYWSKASTGENWDEDWTTTDVDGTNGWVPGGREITDNYGNDPVYIPELEPGDEIIVSLPWYPVMPEDYDPTINKVDVCFLARITEDDSYPYGMSFDEVEDVKPNAINNNNIVTRNFIVTNFYPGNEMKRHMVFFANTADTAAMFHLELINESTINPHFSGNFSEAGFVKLILQDEMFDAWENNGMRGSYDSIDYANKTLFFYGSNTMLLEEIELQGNEKFKVYLEFHFIQGSEIAQVVHLRQLVANVSPREKLYGNVTFFIQGEAEQFTQKPSTGLESESIAQLNFDLFPNPTNDVLTIRSNFEKNVFVKRALIFDNLGRTVISRHSFLIEEMGTYDFNLEGLNPGIYILLIEEDTRKTYWYKFIKSK